MKKRMFLSTILMTLVLLLAVTTATFAWYKATTGNLNAADDVTKEVTTATNPYTTGNYTFTPVLTVDNVQPSMTDDNGVTKHWVGNALVTDTEQPATKYASGTISATSNVAEANGATIAQIMDEIGVGNKAVCVITITSSDSRVKFFKSAPTVTTNGYKGSSTLEYEVTVADLTTAEVLASNTFYWAYSGGTDETVDESDIAAITFTASISFRAVSGS